MLNQKYQFLFVGFWAKKSCHSKPAKQTQGKTPDFLDQRQVALIYIYDD